MAIPAFQYYNWGQSAGESIRQNRLQAQAEQKQNMIGQYLPQALAGDANARNMLYQNAPELGLKADQELQARQAEKTKLDAEKEAQRQGEYVRDLTGVLGGVYSAPAEQRGAAWQQALGRLGSKYTPEELDDLTPEWSDQFGSTMAAELGAYSKESADILSRFGAIPSEQKGGKFDQYRTAGRSIVDLSTGKPIYTDPMQAQEYRLPTGYRPAPGGGMEAIPGGPADPANPLNVKKDPSQQATQDERQSALLLQRIRRAQADIATVLKESPESSRPSVAGEVFGLAGDTARNYANPEARQRIEAAQMDALDAALTLATGAAYTREQLEAQRRAHFPQLGDSKKTADEKNKRFADLVKDAELRSGRATPPMLERPMQEGQVFDFNDLPE